MAKFDFPERSVVRRAATNVQRVEQSRNGRDLVVPGEVCIAKNLNRYRSKFFQCHHCLSADKQGLYNLLQPGLGLSKRKPSKVQSLIPLRNSYVAQLVYF